MKNEPEFTRWLIANKMAYQLGVLPDETFKLVHVLIMNTTNPEEWTWEIKEEEYVMVLDILFGSNLNWKF